MVVWLVRMASYEDSRIVAICSTEDIAKRELFKARDERVKEIEMLLTPGVVPSDDSYEKDLQKQLEILKIDNPDLWSDVVDVEYPYMYKDDVITE